MRGRQRQPERAKLATCSSGYGYDIENRIVTQNSVWLGVSPTVAYSYKPGNKRIWRGTGYVYDDQTFKSVPANEEVTFWSITGQKLTTYNVTQYQPGGPDTLPQLVAAQTGTNYYFGGKLDQEHRRVRDAGSSRLDWQILPLRPGTSVGHARTARKSSLRTSGTARRVSITPINATTSGMGRFMTPDPYTASGGPASPGSWNRYAYASGDPVNGYDPSGNKTVCVDGPNGDGQTCHWEPDDTTEEASCADALGLLSQIYGSNVPWDILAKLYLQGCNANQVTPQDPDGGGGGVLLGMQHLVVERRRHSVWVSVGTLIFMLQVLNSGRAG